MNPLQYQHVTGNTLTNQSGLIWYTARISDDGITLDIKDRCFDLSGECVRWAQEGYVTTCCTWIHVILVIYFFTFVVSLLYLFISFCFSSNFLIYFFQIRKYRFCDERNYATSPYVQENPNFVDFARKNCFVSCQTGCGSLSGSVRRKARKREELWWPTFIVFISVVIDITSL